MIRSGFLLSMALTLVPVPIGTATAQGTTPANKEAATPSVAPATNFDALRGSWVRPDGGYTIVIKNVSPSGQLEAMYYNPNPLPFAKAQASREGMTMRASFELQAGGYGGSTYELAYDPASDRLKGTYYQAVMKQKFDVTFARK